MLKINPIGNVGAKALFEEGIKNNKTLVSLDLAHCEIGKEGAKAIAAAMKVNAGLEHLNLENNQIGDQGATVLFEEGIKVNKALLSLNVAECGIGDEGAKGIAAGIGGNSHLRKLDLTGNAISSVGVAALVDAVHYSNNTLEEVRIGLANHDVNRWDSLRDRMTAAGDDQELRSRIMDAFDEETYSFPPGSESQRLLLQLRSLCKKNRDYKHFKQESVSFPLDLWPEALAHFNEKPDIIYTSLQAQEELRFYGPAPSSRRRTL